MNADIPTVLESQATISDSEKKTRGHSHPVTVPQAQLFHLAKPEDTMAPSHISHPMAVCAL